MEPPLWFYTKGRHNSLEESQPQDSRIEKGSRTKTPGGRWKSVCNSKHQGHANNIITIGFYVDIAGGGPSVGNNDVNVSHKETILYHQRGLINDRLPMETCMEIAALEELIKKAARLCGTQKRFALELGVRPGTVSLWIKGITKPQPSNLQSIHRLINKLTAAQGSEN